MSCLLFFYPSFSECEPGFEIDNGECTNCRGADRSCELNEICEDIEGTPTCIPCPAKDSMGGIITCHPNAYCKEGLPLPDDTFPYTCECAEGYTGTGTNCRDVGKIIF